MLQALEELGKLQDQNSALSEAHSKSSAKLEKSETACHKQQALNNELRADASRILKFIKDMQQEFDYNESALAEIKSDVAECRQEQQQLKTTIKSLQVNNLEMPHVHWRQNQSTILGTLYIIQSIFFLPFHAWNSVQRWCLSLRLDL